MLMRISTVPKASRAVLTMFFAALGGGDVVVVGDGLAARALISSTTLSAGEARALAGAVPGAAEVVDDDLGAALGQLQGVDAPQTAAGAGDDRHPAVKADFVLGDLGRIRRCRCR